MNAGAHGGEMADVLQSVQLALPDGTVCWLPAKEFAFSYRHAILPEGSMVTAARIQLRPGAESETAARRADYLAERKKRQPLTLPSAGSVFKNPAHGGSAGFLIEQAGLRGHSLGGASVSDMHGNWIVNRKREASYSDVIGLIDLCQDRVQQTTGILLEPEIVRWGA
jgi:UDP-N-acetylmuramate dehydrogenase